MSIFHIHFYLDCYIVYGDETQCTIAYTILLLQGSVLPHEERESSHKLIIDKCKHRVAWTLHTTISRHQSQAGWWGVYLKTYTGFEIAPVH